jgi:hypothetical protein
LIEPKYVTAPVVGLDNGVMGSVRNLSPENASIETSSLFPIGNWYCKPFKLSCPLPEMLDGRKRVSSVAPLKRPCGNLVAVSNRLKLIDRRVIAKLSLPVKLVFKLSDAR